MPDPTKINVAEKSACNHVGHIKKIDVSPHTPLSIDDDSKGCESSPSPTYSSRSSSRKGSSSPASSRGQTRSRVFQKIFDLPGEELIEGK